MDINQEIKYNLARAIKDNQEPALVYGRVSTADQKKGLSLEDQNHRAFNYAKEKNLFIIRVFSGSESAYSTGRKNFNFMLDIALENKIHNIIVKNSDRLARNDHDWARLKDLVKLGGLHIHFFELNMIFKPDSTAEEIMFFDSTSTMAKYWSNKIRQASIATNKHKVKKGLCPTTARITGYTYDKQNKIHRINDNEKNFVNYLFDTYDAGKLSVRELAKQAKEDGYPKISKSAVYNMLSNPFYAGEFDFQGERHKGKHDTYISEERYYERLTRMSDHNIGKKKRDNNYLFKNFLTFAPTKKTLTGDLKHGKSGTGNYIYYVQHDPYIAFREDAIFGLIDTQIESLKISEDFAAYTKQLFRAGVDKYCGNQVSTLQAISGNITRLEKEQSKLLDLLVEGIDDQTIRARMDENRKAIKRLEEERQNLRFDKQKFIFHTDDIIDKVRTFPEFYLSINKEQKTEYLRTFAARILIHDKEKIEIKWKAPFCYFFTAEFIVRELSELAYMGGQVRTLEAYIYGLIPILAKGIAA